VEGENRAEEIEEIMVMLQRNWSGWCLTRVRSETSQTAWILISSPDLFPHLNVIWHSSRLFPFITFYSSKSADLSKTCKMFRLLRNARPISQILSENFTPPTAPEYRIWLDIYRDLNEQIAAHTRYVSGSRQSVIALISLSP